MIEPDRGRARRDREVHARIVKHPLGVVGLDNTRFDTEQLRVEGDVLADVLDIEVDMKAFHHLLRFEVGGDGVHAAPRVPSVAGAQPAPLQQFSSR